MSSVLNVKLGVCKVYAGSEGSEVDLGHTIGGCEAIYSPEYHETKVDEFTGVVERWLVGEKLGVKVPLAENTQQTLLKAITHATDAGAYVTIGSKAGKRSSTHAGRIRLHPIGNATNDRSDDVILNKAHSTGEITIGYKNDGEQIIETMFEGLADETRSDGAMLGLIGDSI